MSQCMVVGPTGGVGYNGPTSSFSFSFDYSLDDTTHSGSFSVNTNCGWDASKVAVLDAIASAAVAKVFSDWSITITSADVRVLDF